ncbi:polyprenyl synthetase family protein [[Clostridium] polysaccharolyticum]|uniref:Farnesyl diphosphate synthase n=1 Tax=[Clostridium] polysaccharolyticum TaxID=29364 RepID=A0A1I0A095_9FIRM|nr:farnesyl diphosphate synthase [[Clostridium] polysaccharolyticum]SES87519.1 geranylgeranyl diphosphate synthase, type II [[Clostridium] polysaccharolyticum]
MDFQVQMEKDLEMVEQALKAYLPKEEGQQKVIMEAANYSVNAGGKRLRPIFILETYRLFGGEDFSYVMPFMAAMEMIHTYSLVHDDLPAMDDDDYRRGRKTTHVVFGEAIGVLAGDALLNYAFETALKFHDLVDEKLAKGRIDEKEAYRQTRMGNRALQILASKAGIYGMIGGQVVDVENTDKPLSKEQLDFIYRLKTSALIEASMMIGACMAGADNDSISSVEKIARNIGMAFQIQDDILDVTSTEEVLGKSVLSDEKNHKTTYVTLKGLEQSRQAVKDLSVEAVRILHTLPIESAFIENLINMLVHRMN